MMNRTRPTPLQTVTAREKKSSGLTSTASHSNPSKTIWSFLSGSPKSPGKESPKNRLPMSGRRKKKEKSHNIMKRETMIGIGLSVLLSVCISLSLTFAIYKLVPMIYSSLVYLQSEWEGTGGSETKGRYDIR